MSDFDCIYQVLSLVCGYLFVVLLIYLSLGNWKWYDRF